MIGLILGNRYEITEKIADGGMAFVYKALDKTLDRVVAVKILRPEFSEDNEFLEKFKNEAQSAARLNHPNIVNVYDVGQQDKIHYIIMEYVDGMNLKDLIKEEGAIDEIRALEIVKGISKALGKAHEHKIIHRDIKPHNIMLGSGDIVKVGDFGIAKAVTTSTITNVGSVIGSVHYFSPEQARGGYIDERSDIYSLGIVLFEMLVGRVPFKGDTPVNIALKHIHEEIEFPDDLGFEISEEVKMLVYKMTKKTPDKRHKNVQEVIRDIELLENDMIPDFEEEEDDDYVTKKVDVNEVNKEKREYKKQEESGGKKPMARRKQTSQKKMGKGMMALAVIAALLASGLFVGGAYYFKDVFFSQKYEVPGLEGLTQKEAAEKVKNMGFEVVIDREDETSDKKPGTIISQDPAEGTKAEKGQVIKVVISAGQNKVEVPDLADMKLDDISDILEEAKLNQGRVEYEFSPSIPEGTIISQSPEAGEEAEENSEVDIVVSKGKEEVVKDIPNLVGKNIEDVKSLLGSFKMGDISYREDRNKEEGVVLSQTPKATGQAPEATEISVVVNKIEERTIKRSMSITLPEKEVVRVVVRDSSTGVTVYDKKVIPSEVGGALSVELEGKPKEKKNFDVQIDGTSYGNTTVEF